MIISGSDLELGLINEAGPVAAISQHVDQYFRSETLVSSINGYISILTSSCTSVLVSGSSAKRKLNETTLLC
ncbi:hypothetical protein [Paenibacillus crassostreae]|uniref:hypothetical protein n=1 Tax=Paenibacillus crassostreae TaxID=1763538 RepID=UPI000ABEB888|nr:hypothetical protein [Paenibacillus crassostreae]